MTEALQTDQVVHVARRAYRAAIGRDDHIADAHARLVGGRAGFDLGHDEAIAAIDTKGLGQLLGKILALRAETAATHFTMLDQLLHDVVRQVDRDSETDADITLAAGAVNGGIDAHQFAPQVDQCATRVPEVDRRVSLDEVLDRLDAEPGSPQRRDDARGHGLPEAERIPHGDDEIPDAQRAGIGQRNLDQIVGIHPQHGNVGITVAADNFGAQFAPVLERYVDFVGVLDHVLVGQDQAVGGIDDDPGAQAGRFLDAFDIGQVEEAAKKGVVRNRQLDASASLAARGDVDHRRGNAFKHRRQARQRLAVHLGRQRRPGRRDQQQHQQPETVPSHALRLRSCAD